MDRIISWQSSRRSQWRIPSYTLLWKSLDFVWDVSLDVTTQWVGFRVRNQSVTNWRWFIREAFSESTKCSVGLVFHAAAKCGIAQVTWFCWCFFCVVGSGLWCVQYWICHCFGQSIVTTTTLDTSGFVWCLYHVFIRWIRLACTDRHPCFGFFGDSQSFSHYNHGAGGVEEEQISDFCFNSQLLSGWMRPVGIQAWTRAEVHFHPPKNCMCFSL